MSSLFTRNSEKLHLPVTQINLLYPSIKLVNESLNLTSDLGLSHLSKTLSFFKLFYFDLE